ncbi:hypothetical protein KKE06_03515 [Candidatus Micrarchaeota archaeon]|nr:hypothetical protein [Candidatus Micrarchaeota archaeon]MBU1930960.1 hypothetical protein [Candidatus Micrarchaeota archaeon]
MQKGFASILALITVIMGFGLTQSQFQNQYSFQETIQSMIEGEQNNFERTSLEENTDHIIESTLQEQLAIEELNPLIVNQAISQNLFAFFQDIENENQNIQFYWVQVTPESYDRILLVEPNPLTAEKIMELTKTLIVKTGNIVTGETVFTGGLRQNQAIIAHISSPNHQEFFLIPIQHSTIVQVIA